MRQIHTIDKITDTFYLIREYYCERSGLTIPLVIGNEKAAVLDTGLGVVDTLRTTAQRVTQLPIIAVLSHGHPDHAGAAVLFDEIYMNARDLEQTKWGLTKERRLEDLRTFSENDAEIQRYCEAHVVDCSAFSFRNIEDGDVIDLGGIRLEILGMSGHTKGSVAILNREDGYIYTGDAVCAELMLTDERRESLQESAAGLQRLCELTQEISGLVIYGGHFHDPIPWQMASDLRDACLDILAGRTKEDSRTHFLFAEMNDPDIVLYKHVRGSASVTYNGKIR